MGIVGQLHGLWLAGKFELTTEKRFADLIAQHMGDDAAALFRELLEAKGARTCGGECERTYELQEFYEAGIREALEALNSVKVYKNSEKDYKNALKQLGGLLS